MEKWSLESERRREEIAERPAAKFSWKKKRSQLLFSLSPLLTFPCFIFYFHSDNFYFHSPHCSLFLVYLFFSLSLLLLPFHFSLSLFTGRHSIGSYSGCFYLLLASLLHSFHGKMSFYLTILRDIHIFGKFPTEFLSDFSFSILYCENIMFIPRSSSHYLIWRWWHTVTATPPTARSLS